MNRGYTLIELLVSMTILLLFVGVGIASFLTFNAKQQVVEAAKNVQDLMRNAQIEASAGALPPGCTTLQSYRVIMTAASPTVTLSAVCSNPTAVIQTSSYTMPSTVVATRSRQEDFKVLRGGVSAPGVMYLQTKSGTVPAYNYQFALDAGGSISEGYFY